jgi:hypothetical protein
MSVQKKFICTNFNQAAICSYEVSGDEEHVIGEADRHVIEEHGYQDSPGLREQIRDSLVELNPS